MSVETLLASTTLAELVRNKPSAKQSEMLILEHNWTLEDALRELAKRNVLGAPLFVFPTLAETEGEDIMGERERATYLGWLSISDLLDAVLRALPPLVGVSQALWTRVLKTSLPDTMQRMLITLRSSDDGALFYSPTASISVAETIQTGFLGARTHPAHRVALFDDEGMVCGIASMMDVVRLLHSAQPSVPPELQAGKIGTSPVACVGAGLATIEAFSYMSLHHLSSVCVINPASAAAVAVLSASDLRGLAGSADIVDQLGAPLGVFLAGRRPVVTVPPTASLLEVCKAMVESSVHHLFVVDPVGVPLRCISCTDVLAALRR